MKFAAEYAVPNVHQGCGFTGFDYLAPSFQGGQGNHIVADLDIFVGFGNKIIILYLAGLCFVERGMTGCDHFFNAGWNHKPVFFHLGDGFDQSDGVPGFKRAHGEIKAPFHAVIDFNDGVGNLRDPVGGINQVVGKGFPGIACAFVIAIQHGFHLIGKGLGFLGFGQTRKVRRRIFHIFQGSRINNFPDFFPFGSQLGFIETSLGFVSQILLFDHFFDKIRNHKAVSGFIVYNQVISIAGNMTHGIQPNKVRGLEHGGFGPSQNRPEQGIHFGDADAVFHHDLHRLDYALDPDPVGDKIGGILGPYNAFSQNAFPIIGHKGKNFRQGFFTWNNFQKFHVSDRVEEVRSQKMLTEFLAQPFGHGFQWNTGGVGGNDTAFFTDRLDAFEKFLFDFQIFDHNLDNPVTV